MLENLKILKRQENLQAIQMLQIDVMDFDNAES